MECYSLYASFLHREQRGLFSLYFAWMGTAFYLVNGLDVHKNNLCEWSGTHRFYSCSLLASFTKHFSFLGIKPT